ncbi:MAG: SUMF1/EgtB/PvdO family nonheme iron enzyme [Pirellulaceae bacterium]
MLQRTILGVFALFYLGGLAVPTLPLAGCTAAADDRNITRDQDPGRRFDSGRKWAVLVGINRYLDPAIGDLKYCVADVRLMEKTLKERCGYEEKRILLVADDQGKEHLQPLRINFDNQIRHWLLNARPGDTVLVFFSGHGFLDGNGQGFLAPKDCQKSNLGVTAFRTDELRDMLRQCQASQKILILDCCHAGGVKGDEKAPSSEELSASFRKAEGLITLASCRKTQVSHEWDAKGYGLFTYFLAKGLHDGDADRDGNGVVDTDEVYNYTLDEVSLSAQHALNGKVQTPVRIIGEDVVGKFGLARVARRPPATLMPRTETAELSVRGESHTGRGEAVAEATVELLYRSDPKDRPVRVAIGVTDQRGEVRLTARLTAEQQLRGEFLALVAYRGKSRVWPLDAFPDIRRWDLTVPVEQRELTNSLGMHFVLIPAGEFLMGNSREEVDRVLKQWPDTKREWIEDAYPAHRVRITKPFYLGVHEVTVGEFRKFVESQSYRTEAEKDGEGGYGWNEKQGQHEGRKPEYNWQNTGWPQTDRHPVVNVTWNDAVKFCKWLSVREGRTYRLPTEAEWEYACRAGTTTRYSFGDDPEGLTVAGNVADASAKAKLTKYQDSSFIVGSDGYVFTAPVGQFTTNLFGLHDMHGNIWEWCSDGYDADYYRSSPVDDPPGPSPASLRVYRGGSWGNSARLFRAAYRSGSSPSYRNYFLGFRVALVPPGQ